MYGKSGWWNDMLFLVLNFQYRMYHARIGCDFFQSREESGSWAVDRFQEVSKGRGQITQQFIYIHCRTYEFQ